jgi:hypothetical protein
LVCGTTGEKVSKGKREEFVDWYTMDLEKKQSTQYEIWKDKILVTYTKDGAYIYFLYIKNKSFSRSFAEQASSGNLPIETGGFFRSYTIVKLNPVTGDVQQFDGSLKRTMQATEMKVKDGIVYLVGSGGPADGEVAAIAAISAPLMFVPFFLVKFQYKPFMVQIDMKEDQPVALLTFHKKYGKGYSTIVGFDLDLEENNLLVSTVNNQGTALTTKTSTNEKRGKPRKVKFPKSKIIASMRTKSQDNNWVFAGVYKKQEGIFSLYRSGFSEGLFVGGTRNGKATFSSIIPYQRLNSLQFAFDIAKSGVVLDPSQSKKKAEKVKDGSNILLSVLFHDIVLLDDTVIVVGEVYYPHTHIEQRMVQGSGGNVRVVPVPILDGYKRVGVILFALDAKGNLLWNQAVPIQNGINSMDRTTKLKYHVANDGTIGVSFADGNTIKTATFKMDEPVSIEEVVTFESARRNEKPKVKASKLKTVLNGYEDDDSYLFEPAVEYWTGNSFLEYGVHRSPNKNSKKKELYLQKISLD